MRAPPTNYWKEEQLDPNTKTADVCILTGGIDARRRGFDTRFSQA